MSIPKRSTLIKALKRLTRQKADSAAEFQVNINDETHRTVAITMAEFLDARIRSAMEARMPHLTPDELADLFEERGPLVDFGTKIQLGYALYIFGRKTKDDLGIVREIRNAFSHALLPDGFKTKEIADLCNLLELAEYGEQTAQQSDTYWTSLSLRRQKRQSRSSKQVSVVVRGYDQCYW